MLDLRDAEGAKVAQIEAQIILEWSRSGSATADLLMKRGRDALEREDVTAAIDHFSAVVDHAPGFAEGWVERARSYAALGMFGPAIGDLERALAINPRHFGAVAGLASLLEAIGRPDDAYEAWQQVKAIHPHHDGAREALERLARVVKGQSL